MNVADLDVSQARDMIKAVLDDHLHQINSSANKNGHQEHMNEYSYQNFLVQLKAYK